ncbi:MAG: hypothetical protein K5770_04080 [Lachnospiraceae bacterium]|nr:hypothetical protein [Lachnospiraceae bacterium]
MAFIRKNYLLVIVISVDLVISILSLVLGCLMYTSNYKSTLQNRIYVEVTDLISNIGYGLHFGKTLESYYGMESVLNGALDNLSDVNALYIGTGEGEIIFSTEAGELPDEVKKLLTGNNLKRDNMFYCVFRLTDTANLITASDISGIEKQWSGYYRHLGLVTLAGFLISSCIMALLWKRLKDHGIAYKAMIAVLVLWIISISSFVGYSAYHEYRISIDRMYETIEATVIADLSSVHEQGIDDRNISGLDDYLAGFSDNISELESISYDGKSFTFELSAPYMQKVILDYVMQTLLFLAFSAMILAEYQIFMSGVTQEGQEGKTND